MIQYLVAGGPVMIPIAVASVVALAAFLERVWALRRGRVIPRGLVTEVLELARQGKWDEAAALCRKRDVAVARVLEVGLEMRGRPRSEIKERLEEIGRREAAELERFLSVLATTGHLGPLLGLLGTVGGMIMTFEGVRQSGSGDVNALAGGIAQALICTFAGLVVAIPSVTAHRYLMSKVDGLLVDLEEASLTMLDLVAEDDRGRAPGPSVRRSEGAS